MTTARSSRPLFVVSVISSCRFTRGAGLRERRACHQAVSHGVGNALEHPPGIAADRQDGMLVEQLQRLAAPGRVLPLPCIRDVDSAHIANFHVTYDAPRLQLGKG